MVAVNILAFPVLCVLHPRQLQTLEQIKVSPDEGPSKKTHRLCSCLCRHADEASRPDEARTLLLLLLRKTFNCKDLKGESSNQEVPQTNLCRPA